MRRFLLVLLITLSLVGRAAADDLLVFAAASLTDAMTELGKTWAAQSPTKVAFSFGSSNDLARQTRAGAPADVFFSADVEQVAALERDGLIDPATRRDLLSNLLVVVVPIDSKATITSAADLAGVERLSLGNPDGVPAGRYARAWLQSQGVWDRIAPHVVPAVDVRAALAAVASGNVEAGIVYKTDAAISPKVRVAFEVPRAQGPAIVYALAPLKASKNPEAAAFARFLAGPTATPVYERLGFVVLPVR
ncbi:MAG TPA: molybdate ABC transporter substrate-binding protein [Candidatus Binatia bacterium]|jgi:molybdate transport system substrate-binding protein|nr:molybdate ABC transporter substrate-binding protein [Candidatus Binatia bacterium]